MSNNKYNTSQISLDDNRQGHKKQKIKCPYCKKREKTYVRYIDWSTMQYLPNEYGRCDREINCGAFNKPPKRNEAGVQTRIQDQIAFKSIGYYDKNNLVKFLAELFGIEQAVDTCTMYNIGTAKYFPGACIFWQTDYNDKFRSGKVVGYRQDGHRIKGQNNWVHSLMNINPFELQQCLFGEHLLKHDQDKPVAIFESEKTALIYELANPDTYICLAACGSNGLGGRSLNYDKVRHLRDRSVTLFPDSSIDSKLFTQWDKLAIQMNEYGINANCVNWENELCKSQREKGMDIADLILATLHDYTPSEYVQHEEVDKLFYFPF